MCSDCTFNNQITGITDHTSSYYVLALVLYIQTNTIILCVLVEQPIAHSKTTDMPTTILPHPKTSIGNRLAVPLLAYGCIFLSALF